MRADYMYMLDSRVCRQLVPELAALLIHRPAHITKTIVTDVPLLAELAQAHHDPVIQRVPSQDRVTSQARRHTQLPPLCGASQVPAGLQLTVACGPLNDDLGLGQPKSLLELKTQLQIRSAEFLRGAVRSGCPGEESSWRELGACIQRRREEVDFACVADDVESFDGAGDGEHDAGMEVLPAEAMLVPGSEVHGEDRAEASTLR